MTPAVVATTHAILVLVAALLLEGLALSQAQAQGKLDARYTATLAGIPIGKGALAVDIGDKRYTAAASGRTTGLVRLFASGQGTSASRGFVRNGAIIPLTYASNLSSGNKAEDLRIVMRRGAVKDVSINPPPPPRADRLPVPASHRRGVVDPMSAALMYVSGKGETISAEACHRTIAIFDGRMRFDLQLSFKRMATVQAARGYQGPVAVCAVQFVPLSGYVPHRAAITYLKNQREIEIWLAPVAGTRMMVPFKLLLRTPFGLGVLEATHFVSAPSRMGAAPAPGGPRPARPTPTAIQAR